MSVTHNAVAQLAPKLLAVHERHQEVAKSREVPSRFAVAVDLGKFTLGLMSEAPASPARDGSSTPYILAYLSEHYGLLRAPASPVQTNRAENLLGRLSFTQADTIEALRVLTERVQDKADADDFSTDSSVELALASSTLFAYGTYRSPSLSLPWSRRKERINSEVELKGRFEEEEQRSRDGNKHISKVRHVFNLDTGRLETHILADHYAWLVEKERKLDYRFAKPLTSTQAEDIILVEPPQDIVDEVGNIYKEVNDRIEEVAKGELSYGIFAVDSAKKERTLRLKDPDNNLNELYVIRPEDTELLMGRRSHPLQGCFFRVVNHKKTQSGLDRYMCEVVPPAPISLPKYFRIKSLERGYLFGQLAAWDSIKRVDDRNPRTGVLFQSRPK